LEDSNLTDFERMLLLILYYASSPKKLNERSLSLRAKAILPETSTEELHSTVRKLEREGLCTATPDEKGALEWSITDAGLALLGGPDERLEIRSEELETVKPKLRIGTGITGLDEILGGGIPVGNVVVVRGSPGAGKTILSAQFLYTGITEHDESGVFVSFDVTRTAFLRQLAGLQMHFRRYEGKRFAFLDAAPVRLLSTDSKIDRDPTGQARIAITNLRDDIDAKVKEIRAKRLVIDPITSLTMLYADVIDRRLGILTFFESLNKMGTTSIVTAEASRIGGSRVVEPEEYVSDGVITMETLRVNKTFQRVIQVEKMRETPIDRQPRPYRIGDKGIEVYSKESVI
jgi:KaiC/GvpD/RAD55 family RecA-like ATPase